MPETGGLAGAWLQEHGRLPPQGAQKEELRGVLQRDLEGRGARADVAREEIENLLACGSLSEKNVGRLERRALRGRASSNTVSDYSKGAASARGPPSRSGSVRSTGGAEARSLEALVTPRPLRGIQEEKEDRAEPQAAEQGDARKQAHAGPICTWSGLARYSERVEDQEKRIRVERYRGMQKSMQQDLQKQLDEQARRKQRIAQEDQNDFEYQEAELERWKRNEIAKEAAIKSKVMKVKEEREEQIAWIKREREEERTRKMALDEKLVRQAKEDLEREKATLLKRKEEHRERELRNEALGKLGLKDKEEERQRRLAEERKKVAEFQEMLDREQERNKQPKPVQPPIPSKLASPVSQTGRQGFTDAEIAARFQAKLQERDEEDQRRVEKLKSARQTNQDYLTKQIAERNRLRSKEIEQKQAARKTMISAQDDFITSERQRVEETRRKNIQHRLELEQQIAAKKAAVKIAEDEMSNNERAINKRLLHIASEFTNAIEKAT